MRTDEQQRLRAVIDELDERLVALLAERAAAVDELWAWKARHRLPQKDPSREAAVRERLLRRAEALGLDPVAMERVLDAIVGQRLRRRHAPLRTRLGAPHPSRAADAPRGSGLRRERGAGHGMDVLRQGSDASTSPSTRVSRTPREGGKRASPSARSAGATSRSYRSKAARSAKR